MFSSRIHWSLRENSLSERTTQLRAQGRRLLDLTVSNPTNALLPYAEQSILESFSNPRNLQYQPLASGLLSAREAVASYLSDAHRQGFDPADILLTASTSEAYSYLFKLLCNPGDSVLVPAPSYPLFEFLASLEAVSVTHYPLRYDGNWSLDLHALRACIEPTTRAIVLVNPNNPTGSYLKQWELDGLRALCAEFDLALISDEVFCDYPLREDPQRVTTVAGVDDILSFALGGLSKAAALPQMKLGWTVVAGSPGQRTAAMQRLELIADTFLSVGTPVQHAAQSLLQSRTVVRDAIRRRTAENLQWLKVQLPAMAAGTLSQLDLEGGWYATLQLPRLMTEEQWCLQLLDAEGVLVHPGYFFDFAQEAYLVVSLLTVHELFREGIEAIGRVVSRAL